MLQIQEQRNNPREDYYLKVVGHEPIIITVAKLSQWYGEQNGDDQAKRNHQEQMIRDLLAQEFGHEHDVDMNIDILPGGVLGEVGHGKGVKTKGVKPEPV